MTLTDARKLKVGDRVRWTDENPQNGEVIESGQADFKIRWADNSIAVVSLTHGVMPRFLKNIDRKA